MSDAGASPRLDVARYAVTNFRFGSSIDELERADDGEWMRYEHYEALLAENARLRDEQTYVAGRGIKAESQLSALRLALAGIRAEMEKVRTWEDMDELIAELAHLEQEQQS